MWALVVEKQNIEIELRTRIWQEPATFSGVATVADQELVHPGGQSACLSRSMAGSPLLGGFLVGLALSSTAAFFLTFALCP